MGNGGSAREGDENTECLNGQWAKDPDFDNYDPLYSNQGDAGTCARHAIAKSLIMHVLHATDQRICLQPASLITALNIKVKGGAKNINVMDFAEKDKLVIG